MVEPTTKRSGTRRQVPLRVSPVRELVKSLEASPQRRPLGMTTEVAPAASGRLSVANALSTRGRRLIHHPLAVDCRTSLTAALQARRIRSSDPADREELHRFRGAFSLTTGGR